MAPRVASGAVSQYPFLKTFSSSIMKYGCSNEKLFLVEAENEVDIVRRREIDPGLNHGLNCQISLRALTDLRVLDSSVSISNLSAAPIFRGIRPEVRQS